jgi:hypothetical protein
MGDESAVTEHADGRSARRVAGALTLIAVGFVIPLAIASHYGALGIPRSDDWSYLVTLFRWVHDGRLSFNGWVSMTLIGQLVMAAPIAAVTGRSVWAIQVWSSVIGLGGLFALLALGRQTLRTRGSALFLAVTIACGPMWAPLVTTYMTDVPAFAVQMAALALAGVAFRHRPFSTGWLCASLAVGFLGISIRQYGAVSVVAILVVAAWSSASARDWRRFRISVLLALLVGVATGLLLVWWATLPDALTVVPTAPDRSTIIDTILNAAGFVRLTGLLIFPVLLWAGPRRIVQSAWRSSPIGSAILGGGAAMGLAVTFLRSTHVPFVGNYVDRLGVLSADVLSGHRANVMPSIWFDALVIIGSLGGVLLALAVVAPLCEAWPRLRRRDFTLVEPMTAVLGLSVLGFSVAYGGAVATGLPIFDRYALPAIPLVGLLVLRRSERFAPTDGATESAPRGSVSARGMVLPIIALVVLAVVSLGFATDSASFDATRWRVATMAAQRGYGTASVDGGFEWVAFHRERGPPIRRDTAAERQRLRIQYYRHLCVTVQVDPQGPAAHHYVVAAMMHGWFHAPVPIVASRNDRRC